MFAVRANLTPAGLSLKGVGKPNRPFIPFTGATR
ncbi:hypothetical protein EDF56_101440 [Novosphingobium sp. PhB165]|nr:hypothetical protein EDF56_101440 [Novosphingobium sp. PhB165]